MKRLGCYRTWQDRNRKSINDEAPPRLTPEAAGNDWPQTDHSQNEGGKEYRAARALHVMARALIACQKQGCQTLVFQVALDKIICDVLPRSPRLDVGDLVEPLCYEARIRTIEQNEWHQREAIGQPYLEYVDNMALFGC